MKRPVIFIIVLIIIDLFIWLFYVPAQENRLSKVISDYKTLRERRAKEKILSFKDVFETKDKIGEFEKKLRTRDDFSKVITYIFEKSFASKIEIKSVNYSFEERKELKLTKLSLTIGLEGNYRDIKKYIYDLESGSHLILVDNVKIQKGTELLNTTLTLTTYLKGLM